MSKKWYKKKFVIYAFVLALLTFVVVNFINYKVDYDNQPGTGETNLIAPYLYNFYVSSKPNIQDSPYYGSKEASITIIALLDIDSETSKNFIKNIFPRLNEDYIDKGKVRYYHKNYLTLEDVEEKNENFVYSMALLCIHKLDREKYYDFYFDLFDTEIKDIPKLLRKYKIPRNKYEDCIKEQENIDQLSGDVLEVENLGTVGINQRFYIGIMGKYNSVLTGIPDYETFRETIRPYELQLGN